MPWTHVITMISHSYHDITITYTVDHPTVVYEYLQNELSLGRISGIKWKEQQERHLKLEAPKIESVHSLLHA